MLPLLKGGLSRSHAEHGNELNCHSGFKPESIGFYWIPNQVGNDNYPTFAVFGKPDFGGDLPIRGMVDNFFSDDSLL